MDANNLGLTTTIKSNLRFSQFLILPNIILSSWTPYKDIIAYHGILETHAAVMEAHYRKPWKCREPPGLPWAKRRAHDKQHCLPWAQPGLTAKAGHMACAAFIVSPRSKLSANKTTHGARLFYREPLEQPLGKDKPHGTTDVSGRLTCPSSLSWGNHPCLSWAQRRLTTNSLVCCELLCSSQQTLSKKMLHSTPNFLWAYKTSSQIICSNLAQL
jgi:hypothetical protein